MLWFRRDLRVHDHPALFDAVTRAEHVVPLFVLDERLTRISAPRTWFLAGSLRALDAELSFYAQVLGSALPPGEDVPPVAVENL